MFLEHMDVYKGPLKSSFRYFPNSFRELGESTANQGWRYGKSIKRKQSNKESISKTETCEQAE